MHGVDQTQTFFDAAFTQHILDFMCNIDNLIPVLCIEPKILCMCFHKVIPTCSAPLRVHYCYYFSADNELSHDVIIAELTLPFNFTGFSPSVK